MLRAGTVISRRPAGNSPHLCSVCVYFGVLLHRNLDCVAWRGRQLFCKHGFKSMVLIAALDLLVPGVGEKTYKLK